MEFELSNGKMVSIEKNGDVLEVSLWDINGELEDQTRRNVNDIANILFS